MKNHPPAHRAPKDADKRRSVAPVLCYPGADHFDANLERLLQIRAHAARSAVHKVPARDGKCVFVPQGAFFRIAAQEGAQVGDLNLWAADHLDERFYSGKTRALHGTHLSTGDHLWSSFPYLRPMATIVDDSLDWYGFDAFGTSVHDVIGTRCDPYTGRLLGGNDYHYCCHSNLIRALSTYADLSLEQAEPYVHDVLNVFMCTGFSRNTSEYIMKASPVRVGDYLEFYAQIDLIVGLSACPGGDCSATHSSDEAQCYALDIEIYDPGPEARASHRPPEKNAYSRTHGCAHRI